jgi:CHAD domain-containing protein
MAYKLSIKKSVQDEVKRIANEQIDKAITELNDDDSGLHNTVHQVRKRCKKIRGLIRIVRPEFSDYDLENAFFRDAANRLSYLRDTQAMIETYDNLMEVFNDQVERQSFAPIRRALTLRRQQITGNGNGNGNGNGSRRRLARFHEKMLQAGRRVADWSVTTEGFAAIEGGLQKTYRRARRAMNQAYAEEVCAERFHEWRKRVKYHRYHLRLLRSLWPPVMEAHWRQAQHLSRLLGEEHDLAVLQQMLVDCPEEFAGIAALPAFQSLLKQRRAQLQQQSRGLGERVLAEKPQQLSHRLQRYWESRT